MLNWSKQNKTKPSALLFSLAIILFLDFWLQQNSLKELSVFAIYFFSLQSLLTQAKQIVLPSPQVFSSQGHNDTYVAKCHGQFLALILFELSATFCTVKHFFLKQFPSVGFQNTILLVSHLSQYSFSVF